jgi:hypothetical protein
MSFTVASIAIPPLLLVVLVVDDVVPVELEVCIDDPLDAVVPDSPPFPPVPVSVWQPWRLEPTMNAPVRAPIPTNTHALRLFI